MRVNLSRMSNSVATFSDLGLRDAGFGVLALVSAALLIPAQLVSMIAFDSTGLDTVTPDLVFMAVLPALAVTLLPALVAHRLYTRDMTLASTGGILVLYTLIAAYLIQFYGMCGGPSC